MYNISKLVLPCLIISTNVFFSCIAKAENLISIPIYRTNKVFVIENPNKIPVTRNLQRINTITNKYVPSPIPQTRCSENLINTRCSINRYNFIKK
jgi:hypothetical protein